MNWHTTDSFFTQLRSDYLRLRGYATRCFSIWCYSHCDFYKASATSSYIRHEQSNADFLKFHYDYTPKPMANMPPITKHEFKKRHEASGKHGFHLRCIKKKAHNRNLIELLPRKVNQLDLSADERKLFWGLYARQEISFFRVLVYNVICISPLVWFFFMWLFAWGHAGDQQNASVPLMIMLSFLSIFWTTFIASLWQKIDGDAS
ncbi:hypothetical protein P171DRAFT_364203 [Karstenula rhodostoma CBS 690.94]|uniref:Uncharacterized protein n=1 Tax=Karstenula rhodostoma CBS 690.94 TaxID=1392251 RepID=A0A9P4PGM0_9PLEO|nr:hypothetical protein P171DRAFT_364203 [Karstenula rhodostoma CBS 690.94]